MLLLPWNTAFIPANKGRLSRGVSLTPSQVCYSRSKHHRQSVRALAAFNTALTLDTNQRLSRGVGLTVLQRKYSRWEYQGQPELPTTSRAAAHSRSGV